MVPADRAETDVQVEDLAQGDIEAANPATDRGGQGALDSNEVAAEGVDGLFVQIQLSDLALAHPTVFDKLGAKLAELESASTLKRQEEELGDLLFAVANWARWLGVDPETALRTANARFARRFRWLERAARDRGLDITKLSIDELEALWQEAKMREVDR